MGEVFRLIFITSIYASIVGLIIIVFKALLKDKISPNWHYIIWLVLILKLMIPLNVESDVSVFNAVPKISIETDFSGSYKAYHSRMNVIRQEKSNIPTSWQAKDITLSLAAVAESAAPYIWVLGMFLMLIWLGYTNYSLYRALKRSRTPPPERLIRILQECRNKMDLKADVGIMLQKTAAPALYGIIKPNILITHEVLRLSDRELSYIILHELSHYKRRDLLVNQLLLLLQTVHWFNPVIWYCFKHIRRDMEVAADVKVLAVLGENEQKDYGRALLSVLESFRYSRPQMRLVSMVDDKRNIERRIRMIIKAKIFQRHKRLYMIAGVILIFILGAGLLTNGITKASPAGTASKAIKVPASTVQSISKAVSNAILGQGRGYGLGECSTEGHYILDIEEKGETTKVYTVSSFGAFGFENDIFTKISGSGAIPTVITLNRNENGSYKLVECREPMEGSYYAKSIKEMFPKKLWSKVLSSQTSYANLAKQQEDQAKAYLKKIGRNAKVSSAYVSRTLVKIDVQASNKLFSELTKYNSELNNFPYWIGSREILVNNIRYIYTTSQSKASDGHDLVIFKKTTSDGKVIEQYNYKIIGSEVMLLNKQK